MDVEKKDKAIQLFSKEGLKLGNYHYDVDRYENDDGKVEVYLTRYYEECANCPLFENNCQGDTPPFPNDKYPCSKMLPIMPYEEQGYEFYDVSEIKEHSEFTEIERLAIEILFEKNTDEILSRLNN